ncbi:protein-arginine deiminase family protein [Nannocystis pusilla]|uniref:protein-arginine deiminase family protein n=1 Tax=Nannocystis pusilla TaxID=889268 RepID=UPI003B7EC507
MPWGGIIDRYPRERMLEPGFGWVQAMPPTIGGSLDSFGNLECSPPFTHRRRGKEYNSAAWSTASTSTAAPGATSSPKSSISCAHSRSRSRSRSTPGGWWSVTSTR